ncbi:MAG: mechanosensitive ion channel [Saprospiraceae bacterium]|nr:mechanosensitive ion channel [Saprospiraceae bacterium]
MKLEYIIRFGLKAGLLAGLIFYKSGDWLAYQPDSSFARSSVVISAVNFAIFWLTANIFIRLNQFIYRKRKKLGDKYSDNVIVGLQNIYFLLTGIGIMVMLLGMFGIEFSKLLTALSIVAAALAIISKEIVSDIITGFIISFSKDIALGDYVRIANIEGKVLDINIYKIVLLTEKGELVYVPNSKAYFSEIINFSKIRNYQVELEFALNVSMFKPASDLEQIILSKIKSENLEIQFENLHVWLSGISGDDVKYTLVYQLPNIELKSEQKVNDLIYTVIANIVAVKQ